MVIQEEKVSVKFGKRVGELTFIKRGHNRSLRGFKSNMEWSLYLVYDINKESLPSFTEIHIDGVPFFILYAHRGDLIQELKEVEN